MFRSLKDIDKKSHKYLWNHKVMDKKTNKFMKKTLI